MLLSLMFLCMAAPVVVFAICVSLIVLSVVQTRRGRSRSLTLAMLLLAASAVPFEVALLDRTGWGGVSMPASVIPWAGWVVVGMPASVIAWAMAVIVLLLPNVRRMLDAHAVHREMRAYLASTARSLRTTPYR